MTTNNFKNNSLQDNKHILDKQCQETKSKIVFTKGENLFKSKDSSPDNFKSIAELEKELKQFEEDYPDETISPLIYAKYEHTRGELLAKKECLKMIEESILEDDYMSIDTKQAMKKLKQKLEGK